MQKGPDKVVILYFIRKLSSKRLEKEGEALNSKLCQLQCEIFTVSDDLKRHVTCRVLSNQNSTH